MFHSSWIAALLLAAEAAASSAAGTAAEPCPAGDAGSTLWDVRARSAPWYDRYQARAEYYRLRWPSGQRPNKSAAFPGGSFSASPAEVYTSDGSSSASALSDSHRGKLQVGFSASDASEFDVSSVSVRPPRFRIDGYYTDAELHIEHRRNEKESRRSLPLIESIQSVIIVLPLARQRLSDPDESVNTTVCFLKAALGMPRSEGCSGGIELDLSTILEEHDRVPVPERRSRPLRNIMCSSINPFTKLSWIHRAVWWLFCEPETDMLVLPGNDTCNGVLTLVSQVPVKLPWAPAFPPLEESKNTSLHVVVPSTAKLRMGLFPPFWFTAEEGKGRTTRYGLCLLTILMASAVSTIFWSKYIEPRCIDEPGQRTDAPIQGWRALAVIIKLLYSLMVIGPLLTKSPHAMASCYEGAGWEMHIGAVTAFAILRLIDMYAHSRRITGRTKGVSLLTEAFRYLSGACYFFSQWLHTVSVIIARTCGWPWWILMACALCVRTLAGLVWIIVYLTTDIDPSGKTLFNFAHMYMVSENLNFRRPGEGSTATALQISERPEFHWRNAFLLRGHYNFFMMMLLVGLFNSTPLRVSTFYITFVVTGIDMCSCFYTGLELKRVYSHLIVSMNLQQLEREIESLDSLDVEQQDDLGTDISSSSMRRSSFANSGLQRRSMVNVQSDNETTDGGEHVSLTNSLPTTRNFKLLKSALDNLAVRGIDDHPEVLKAQRMIAEILPAQPVQGPALADKVAEGTVRKCIELLSVVKGGGTIIVIVPKSCVKKLRTDTLDGGHLMDLLATQSPDIDEPHFRKILRRFGEHSVTDRWTTEILNNLAKDLDLNEEDKGQIHDALADQPMDGAIILDSGGKVLDAAVKLNHTQQRWRLQKHDGTFAGTRHASALATGVWLSNQVIARHCHTGTALKESCASLFGKEVVQDDEDEDDDIGEEDCAVLVRSDAGGIHIILPAPLPVRNSMVNLGERLRYPRLDPPQVFYWSPGDDPQIPWERYYSTA